MILLSIGRRPLVSGLNLEGLGMDYDSKGIKVDENYETNVKSVYAIGDVTGGWMLAHVASEQGIITVEKILGRNEYSELGAIPNCVFSFPEIATTGMTEEEAKEAGMPYKVGKFMFAANGKALSLGEKEGFVKIIATMDDTIIGVHILGPHASDLIHEGVLAINKSMKVDDIIHTIHAHPTLGECFSEAAMAVKNMAIHGAPKRK
jgi:dihydrolipoamide dehydrogenase